MTGYALWLQLPESRIAVGVTHRRGGQEHPVYLEQRANRRPMWAPSVCSAATSGPGKDLLWPRLDAWPLELPRAGLPDAGHALSGARLRLLLTPKEKKYLCAMAELGSGPHRSGDIADSFDAAVSSLAPTRSSLIAKGMVWSPNHGDTAFTVPMFDEFMKRVIPGDSWR